MKERQEIPLGVCLSSGSAVSLPHSITLLRFRLDIAGASLNYFDNFKYVFPRIIANKNDVRVLNNSRGTYKFCCVKYNGQSIVVEDYDLSQKSAKISNYFITDETREFIANEFLKGDFGEFLLQVSGNNIEYIKKLYLGSNITIKQEN